MQIKGKLFPYPVINHNKSLSNYLGVDFDLRFEDASTNEQLILHNVGFVTNSTTIKSLIGEGKIAVALILECPDVILRRKYDVTTDTIDIVISTQELRGRIEMSLYAYARHNFKYLPEDVDEDYKDLEFQIEKYDIIAANDGFAKSIIHKDSEENLVKSIFSIQAFDAVQDGVFEVQYENSKKILISMSQYDHANYNIVYSMPIFQEVFFNMMLIPALTQALTACFEEIRNGLDIDDILLKYQWFTSIQKQYHRLKGEELSAEIIANIQQPITFAQEILGRPMKVALEKLIESTKTSSTEE